MFRTTSSALKIKTLIYCRPPRDIQVAPFSRLPPTADSRLHHREKALRPASPPPPTKNIQIDRLVWGGLAVMTVTAFGITYIHDSPEFRDWLSLYAPWLDDLIAILYQENTTYKELADQCILDFKKLIISVNPLLEKYFPERKVIPDVSIKSSIRQSEDKTQ